MTRGLHKATLRSLNKLIREVKTEQQNDEFEVPDIDQAHDEVEVTAKDKAHDEEAVKTWLQSQGFDA